LPSGSFTCITPGNSVSSEQLFTPPQRNARYKNKVTKLWGVLHKTSQRDVDRRRARPLRVALEHDPAVRRGPSWRGRVSTTPVKAGSWRHEGRRFSSLRAEPSVPGGPGYRAPRRNADGAPRQGQPFERHARASLRESEVPVPAKKLYCSRGSAQDRACCQEKASPPPVHWQRERRAWGPDHPLSRRSRLARGLTVTA
jgi:hypothetical protein